MQNKFQDKFDHVLRPMSTHRKIQRYYTCICNLRCKTLKEIIVVLHSGSSYDKSVGGTLRGALLVPRKRHREVSNILGANKKTENDNR